MHSLRFFSNAEVAERLAYPQLIEALRIGLAKPCSAPLRNCHALPAQASLLQMPVWQAGAGIGVKLVTVFPGNGARGLPAVARCSLCSTAKTVAHWRCWRLRS